MTWALKHITQRAGDLCNTRFFRIAAVDQHSPRFWFQETDGMLDEGRLACAVGTQNRNDVTAFDFKIDPMQDFGTGLITKRDMLKFNQCFIFR